MEKNHPKESSVPKTVFPRLLKGLTDDLNNENLVSGFKKCGIYPLDRNQVLNCLPCENDAGEANLLVDDSLIDLLKSASGKKDAATKRGKKISFASGKDIPVSTKDAESEEDHSEVDESDMDTDDGSQSDVGSQDSLCLSDCSEDAPE